MTIEGYKRHKELIEAWANGAEIEYLNLHIEWEYIGTPSWDENIRYRIKQDPVYEW